MHQAFTWPGYDFGCSAATLAHIASKTDCLQGGDAKVEQEEVKAEAEATPSESADGASAETKQAEEASLSLPV